MPNGKTLYEVLGVNQNATEAEIRKAYRSLSLKYHPDRNSSPDANERFQEINSANEILSDPARRNQYDMELKGGIPGGFPPGFPGGHGFHGFPGGGTFHFSTNMDGANDFNDLSHIFNAFFGMPGAHGMPGMPGGPGMMFHNLNKPPPIVKNIQINMEQVFTGCMVPVEIERWNIINDTKHMETETIYVNIPQGIDDNEIIVMREQGNSINDTIKGDIKFVIQVSNNTNFIRNGLDIVYKKTITLKEALCGFTFEVKHLNGKTLIFSNVGEQRSVIKPNYQKHIEGLGLKRGNNNGRLIINFDVEFPDVITDEQMNKLKEIL